MRAIITGSHGFIGSHLVDALVDSGVECVCIDDMSTGLLQNLADARMAAEKRGLYFRTMVCDAGKGVWRHIHEADVVFHLAAVVGVERVMRYPGLVLQKMHETSKEVVNCCVEHNVRLLITSTSEVYGRSTDCPFREDQDCHIGPPTAARWSYALVKLMDEFMAMDAWERLGLQATVVRLFNTVGPRQSCMHGMVLPRFCHQALNGERLTIHGDGSQSRCFAHVKDVVKCLLMLSQKEFAGEVFNVGSTEEVTILKLAAEVQKAVVEPFRCGTGVEYVDGRSTDMARRVPDVSKLRSAIGFVPNTPLPTIVRDVIEGMRRLF